MTTINIKESTSTAMANKAINFIDFFGGDCIRSAWLNTSQKANGLEQSKKWRLTLQCCSLSTGIDQFQIRIGKKDGVPLDDTDIILILDHAGFPSKSAQSLIHKDIHCLYKS